MNTKSTPPPEGLAEATGWDELTADQRNTKVGEMLQAEPMRQTWLVRTTSEGKRITLGGLHLSRDEAEIWLEHAKQSPLNWREKMGAEQPFAFAPQVAVEEVVWHIRYSDTPGGGWIVVEAMHAAGFAVVVQTTKSGWKVTCDDGNPNHGRSSEVAATMAEAACKLALRRLRPNVRISDGEPKTL